MSPMSIFLPVWILIHTMVILASFIKATPRWTSRLTLILLYLLYAFNNRCSKMQVLGLIRCCLNWCVSCQRSLDSLWCASRTFAVTLSIPWCLVMASWRLHIGDSHHFSCYYLVKQNNPSIQGGCVVKILPCTWKEKKKYLLKTLNLTMYTSYTPID